VARNIALGFCFFLFFPFLANCEEVPVRIAADNLKFDQEAGIITASGSVEILFEGITIESDSARIDVNANIATAEGRVKIKRPEYDISSSGITYNISSETAVVFKLKTVFYPTDVKTNLYVSADKLTDLPELKMGENGALSTCDYDPPHYHINARWFDYYPDDKLVGYWVIMYVEGVPTPIMTPYYIYNMKTKRSPYNFVYGQNEVEGRFLKTSFDYFINNSAYGIFYFDTTENKGPGYGILHDYKLNDQNSGSLYYYWMNERDTKLNDYVFKLKHTIDLDQYSKLTLAHDSAFIYQVPSGRRYDTDSSVNYTLNTGLHQMNLNYSASDNMYTYLNSRAFNINNRYGSYNTGFSWDESQSTAGQKWKSAHDRFFHEQSLFTDDAKLSVNVNYSSYATDEGVVADEKLEPRIDLTYRGSFYSLRLTENWYIDPDGNSFRGDINYNYLERLPEMEIAFRPIDMRYFNLNLTVGAARYHEAQYVSAFARMRHMTANRYSMGAGLSRTDNLGFGTRLRSGLNLDQFDYDTGDQRYQFRESLNMETNQWGFFRNNADWGRARVEGNTPFFFESLGSRYNYITDKITLYYLNQLTFDISAGYNYQNSTYNDILSNLQITPNEQLSFRASSGWSVENQIYRDLVTSVTVTPFPKFINTASIVYDMNNGKLLSANSLVDLEIGNTWENSWHFKMGHSYDFFEDRYMLRDLAIVKDLHCWEAVFTYNDYLKEYRFGMTLKAFPQFPISYVSSENGNYFNSFMDNMHFEQASPKRD
jgi:lipopolysaccharide export system protein LptA